MKIFVCTFLASLTCLMGVWHIAELQVDHWILVPFVALALAGAAQAFEVILPPSWVKWLDEFRL